MRATAVLTMAGLFALFVGGTFQPASANLVVDGGFETGSFTSGWSTINQGPIAGFAVVSTNANSGTYSADISNADSTLYDIIYQDIPTVASQQYTLTFWVFDTVDDANDSLRVDWGGVNVLNQTPVSTTVNTWQQVTVSPLTASSGMTELRFSGLDSTGSFLIDDICLVVVPEASAFVAMGLIASLSVAAVKLRRRLRSGQ